MSNEREHDLADIARILRYRDQMTEKETMTAADFTDVKEGDTVTRLFYGQKLPLLVTKVDDTLIHTKGGWTFDRATGFEEDPEIGMGVSFGVTCSQLIRE